VLYPALLLTEDSLVPASISTQEVKLFSMKLLLGINLALAVVVLTFLLLRKDGRAPDQTRIPRAAAETAQEAPEAKKPARDEAKDQRQELPGATPPIEAARKNQDAAPTGSRSKLGIAGRVLDPDGKPVKGYGVKIERDEKPVAMVMTDKEGRFQLRAPEPGDYLLTGQDGMRAMRNQSLAPVRIGVHSGAMDLIIRLEPGKSGEIRALLTGFGKILIPDKVQVTIKNLDKVTGGYLRILACPGGRMRIPGIEPGRYTIEFFIPELLADCPVITVHENRVTDLGRIWFHPIGAIAGVILDDKGRPLPGVEVYAARPYTGWLHPDPKRTIPFPKPSTITDASGRFATKGYRDPWTLITFTMKGYAPLEVYLTNADMARTLRLRLYRAATLEVRGFPRFLPYHGRQCPIVYWNLIAHKLPKSHTLWKDNPLLQSGIQKALPLEGNAFTISDLPPGRYRIRCQSPPGPYDRKLKNRIERHEDREVELHAGQTTKLDWK